MIKRVSTILILAGAGALAIAPVASAQVAPWEDRGFINISGAMQQRSKAEISSTNTYTIYDEQAKIATAQTIDASSAFFDISGGARVVGNLGIGLGYTNLKKTGQGTVVAQIPHPLIYDSPRTASSDQSGLEHRETALHVMALYFLPFTEKFDVALFGGPTYFKLSQGVISDATVAEVGPPYTQVNITDVAVVTSEGSKWGYNVGADVTYRFTTNFGIGGFLRYTKATIDIETVKTVTQSFEVGGMQFGAGLRVRF